MKFSKQLYIDVQPIWEGYLSHPFLLALFDGTLPIEKFHYYMLQDYHYLLQYAKVFALGIAKAKNIEQMQFFAQNVHQILHGEMQIHHSYMQRLGILPAEVESTPMAHANHSYTSYMLAEAYNGGIAEVLAAILACSWSYADIATRMLACYPQAAAHPFYGEWVNGYASASYCQTNQDLIDRFDALCMHLEASAQMHIRKIFYECSRYEADFWDMAWQMQR